MESSSQVVNFARPAVDVQKGGRDVEVTMKKSAVAMGGLLTGWEWE